MLRVDPKADRTLRLIGSVSEAVSAGELRPDHSSPKLRRFLGGLPLSDVADAYKFIAASHTIKRGIDGGITARASRASSIRSPTSLQIVGGTALGGGNAVQLVPGALKDPRACSIFLELAQADLDIITSDSAKAQQWLNTAQGLYETANSEYKSGNYAESLQTIAQARIFDQLAYDASLEAEQAWRDLSGLKSNLEAGGCDLSAYESMWASANQAYAPISTWATGYDANGNSVHTPTDDLTYQLNGLETQDNDGINGTKMADQAKAVGQCLQFNGQWYGGDFLLSEDCTQKLLTLLESTLTSNTGNALQGVVAAAAATIPDAGPLLAVMIAIIVVDENAFHDTVKRIDKGNGVAVHVSHVGWANSDLAGVSAELAVQATTGFEPGTDWLSTGFMAWQVGMWITHD